MQTPSAPTTPSDPAPAAAAAQHPFHLQRVSEEVSAAA